MPIVPNTLPTFSFTKVTAISLILTLSFNEKIYSAIGTAKLVLPSASASGMAEGGFSSSVGCGRKKSMRVLTVSHL